MSTEKDSLLRVPSGYHLEDIEELGFCLHRDDHTESFRLCSRHFYKIDHYLGYLPSQLIQFFLENADDKVNVLDLVAGVEVLSAEQISQKYGPKVRVIAIDLVVDSALGPTSSDRLQADAAHIPAFGNKFDLVYSFQLMSYIHDEAKHIDIVKEIVRVLKPGGVAVLESAPNDRRIGAQGGSRGRTGDRLRGEVRRDD